MSAKADVGDLQTLLSRFEPASVGRVRPVVKAKPRDRLVGSLQNQIQILQAIRKNKDPKEEGLKGHKMFFQDGELYVVQLRYNNTPIELAEDVDALKVENLDEVEEVINSFIALVRSGTFDDQINRIAAEWISKRGGKLGRKKSKPAPIPSEAA